jgi:uncharacterized membrane protein
MDVMQSRRGFAGNLLAWLGRFQAAAVHFPIALLLAAALAELLRIVTGKSSFDDVSSYCIWLATAMAIVAALLGWLRGGFRFTDPSWIMSTHRWLGTCSVACAGFLVLLYQQSRVTSRCRARTGFRITLLLTSVLVLLTGFFGGAVVFGLDHYAWPHSTDQ